MHPFFRSERRAKSTDSTESASAASGSEKKEEAGETEEQLLPRRGRSVKEVNLGEPIDTSTARSQSQGVIAEAEESIAPTYNYIEIGESLGDRVRILSSHDSGLSMRRAISSCTNVAYEQKQRLCSSTSLPPANIRALRSSLRPPTPKGQNDYRVSFSPQLRSTRSFVATDPVMRSPYPQDDDDDEETQYISNEKWRNPAAQYIGDARPDSVTSPQNLLIMKNFTLEHSILGAVSLLNDHEFVPPLSKLRNSASATRMLIDLNIPNYHYEKKIYIRYTYNDWKDKVKQEDIEAKWIYSLTPSIDVFRAEISIGPLISNRKINSPDQVGVLLSEKKGTIAFCVKYTYGSQEQWHNNDGKNYHIEVRSIRRRPILENVVERFREKLPSSPLQLPSAVITNAGSQLAQPIPKLAKPRSCYDLSAHLLRWNTDDHSMIASSPSPPLMIL